MLSSTCSTSTASRPHRPAAQSASPLTFLPPTAVSRHHRRSQRYQRSARDTSVAAAASATLSDTTRPTLLNPNLNHTPSFTAASSPPASTPDPEARCVGAMLGAMCGNVLGAPVQNDRHWLVTRRFPHGVKDFWRFDFAEQAASYGHYTGDYSMLLATARSLVAAGTCDAEHLASFLTQISLVEEGPQQHQQEGQQQQQEGEPQQQEQQQPEEPQTALQGWQLIAPPFDSQEGRRERRMPPYTSIILSALATSNKPLSSLPHLALKFLNVSTPRNSQISGDRFGQEPYGPADNGAAARILPVALAYRDAPAEVLEQAVQEACLFSHPHPAGLDGARVAAAAVTWLSRQGAAGPGSASSSSSSSSNGTSGPQQLLRHLHSVARTDDMKQKLSLLQEQLFQVGRVSSWRRFYQGAEWTRLASVMSQLTYHGYATSGTEAVSVALLALVSSWAEPEQAVALAASFGGSAPVTSQLTGAFAGALHGDAWIPVRWLEALENGPEGGRDRVVALSKDLAALRCGAEEDSAPLASSREYAQ